MAQSERDKPTLSLDRRPSVIEQSDPSVAAGLACSTPSLEQRLEQTIRSHTPRLLAVARRLLGSSVDAEDSVQEAFALAFTALHRFEERCQLSTWLHRITVNVALSKLRARRRSLEQLSLDPSPSLQTDEGRGSAEEAEAFSLEEVLQQREDGALLLACIEQLPESYRRVIVLRDVEELDTRSVARLLGVSDSVVKVRLHRARQALRVRLVPRLTGEELSRSLQ